MAEPNESRKTECFSELLARTVLDSISAHIAVLDETGLIQETNRAWIDFACANMENCPSAFQGVNYLDVCRAATGEEAVDAKRAGDGIRAVINGEIGEFRYDYPCHSPAELRWFYMRAVRLADVDPVRVVVSHEDITALKLAEEALKESREELNEQKQGLEEANIALKVLLKQRENDKLDLERKVLTNVKDLVLPYLERLKRTRLKPSEKTLVGIIDTHINDIISPLLQRLSNANMLLTPQEIQVATLVKDGKTSKEIADLLNISETTVHFHRKNLRRKFGLQNRGTNLRAYLMSLS